MAPFWSYGFRPFFLLAALAAVAAMGVLFLALWHGIWPAGAMPFARWHGHEMLFGFVGAAIAGFLLTAVPTWTNTPAVKGAPLAALVALWVAGRIVMSPGLALQGTPLVFIDALFFPALAVAVGAALLRTRNYRNLPFLVILSVLTLADLAFLGAHLGWVGPLSFDPLRLVANLAQLMIAVIGGRIIPLFTRNALLSAGTRIAIRPAPWLGRAIPAVLAAVVIVDVVQPEGPLAGVLAAIAAVLLAVQLAFWHGHRTLRMPIVWILHAGYAWLVVALACKAAWTLGGMAWAAHWLHALTAGAFGTMILGVMTRVALGHTGRALVVGRAIALAYVLVIAGAALRVVGPAIAPAAYLPLLAAAMACWVLAFAVFIVVYLPVLVAPRAGAQVSRSAVSSA